MKPGVLLRGIAFIASLVAIGYLLQALGLGSALDKGWIDADVRGQGLAGEALFVVSGLVFTAVGLPRQAIAFLGGYAFGFVEGTALATLAAALGASCTFFYARFFGRALVADRFPGKVRRVDGFLRDNPFSMTLLIRLLPVGSNVATNLAAGVSSVRPLPYLAGSALGYIPQHMVFALGGSGIHLDPVLRISLSVLLFVASGLLGVYLYRRYRHGKHLDAELERQIGAGDDAEEAPVEAGKGA